MTSSPLLYSYRRCPYAMRARMALLQAGISFDVHEIVLREKPADMLALSPKGTVPILKMGDGSVLEQSLDIMRWAFVESGDADGWWGRSQSSVNRALLAACDGAFKHHLDRYKYPDRFDDSQGHIHHRAHAAMALLTPLEKQLQGRAQLGGDAACAADIAIFPFVRQFAAVDPSWFDLLPLPTLKTWLKSWLAAGLFKRAMVRLTPNVTVTFPAA